MTIFWVKGSIILFKLAQISFLHQFKNKIIYIFVMFVATKKDIAINFFPPLSFVAVLDPGPEIRDGQKSGSGINIPDPQH
jgi:hypothetical protein